jgi:hypothetical protein
VILSAQERQSVVHMLASCVHWDTDTHTYRTCIEIHACRHIDIQNEEIISPFSILESRVIKTGH